MFDKIERRPAKRPCTCRGCQKYMEVGEEIITTHTYSSRGGQIIFCLDCALTIGRLVNMECNVGEQYD